MINNLHNSAREVYRCIPFISPALTIDTGGNYLCEIDHRIVGIRKSLLQSCFVIGPCISLAVSSSYIAPIITFFGTAYLGRIGFNQDLKLTASVGNKLVIEKCLKGDDIQNEVNSWVLADVERLKLLLDNKSLSSSKKDLICETLLERTFGTDKFEHIACVWDHSSTKIKAKTFIKYVDKTKSESRLFGLDLFNYNVVVNHLISSKRFSPNLFCDNDQYYLLKPNFKSIERDLKFIEKLLDVGFDLGVKDKWNRSVLECMSDDIVRITLTREDVNYKSWHPIENEEKILKLRDFLQAYFAEQLSNPIAKNQFYWDYRMNPLKALAPYLVVSGSVLSFAFETNNARICNLLWDKADNEDKKRAFQTGVKKSKIAISLMEDKKITPDFFTSEERFHLFNNFLCRADFEVTQTIEKLIEMNFYIGAKSWMGRDLKESVLADIECAHIFNYSYTPDGKKEKMIESYKNTLGLLEKAFLKQNLEAALILEAGFKDEGSNISMFPQDIINEIVKTMTITNK